MSSRKVTTKKPRRIRRTSSNVFAMFDQAQIQEFKEAFNLIDQNHDGFIDKDDLQEMLASLGIRFPQFVNAVLSRFFNSLYFFKNSISIFLMVSHWMVI